jgi:uncharacterized protein DUF6527
VKQVEVIEPLFVAEIPGALDPGMLYISIDYDTVTHLCCCGCGNEVVTPLHPTRWSLTYDGETVSLHPSVGSWSLPCRSHYVIKKNRVLWAGPWSEDQIEAGRARDARALERYFSAREAPVQPDGGSEGGEAPEGGSWLTRLWRRMRGAGTYSCTRPPGLRDVFRSLRGPSRVGPIEWPSGSRAATLQEPARQGVNEVLRGVPLGSAN